MPQDVSAKQRLHQPDLLQVRSHATARFDPNLQYRPSLCRKSVLHELLVAAEFELQCHAGLYLDPHDPRFVLGHRLFLRFSLQHNHLLGTARMHLAHRVDWLVHGNHLSVQLSILRHLLRNRARMQLVPAHARVVQRHRLLVQLPHECDHLRDPTRLFLADHDDWLVLGNHVSVQLSILRYLLCDRAWLHMVFGYARGMLRDRLLVQLPLQLGHLWAAVRVHLDHADHSRLHRHGLFVRQPPCLVNLPSPAWLRLGLYQLPLHWHANTMQFERKQHHLSVEQRMYMVIKRLLRGHANHV